MCTASGDDDAARHSAVIGRLDSRYFAAGLLENREDARAVVLVHLDVWQSNRIALDALCDAVHERKRRAEGSRGAAQSAA